MMSVIELLVIMLPSAIVGSLRRLFISTRRLAMRRRILKPKAFDSQFLLTLILSRCNICVGLHLPL